jgi:hypothetical protein
VPVVHILLARNGEDTAIFLQWLQISHQDSKLVPLVSGIPESLLKFEMMSMYPLLRHKLEGLLK